MSLGIRSGHLRNCRLSLTDFVLFSAEYYCTCKKRTHPDHKKPEFVVRRVLLYYDTEHANIF